MALARMTSPHARGNNRTQTIMLWVLGATIPGVLVMTWFYGFGTLINILLASAFAIACEALILWIRKRPISFFLSDGSALVTAWLLALALPPLAPWWLVLVAVSFAIIFGKHLYGGLGQNPFNPAMLGYALVLVSFPVEMTSWPGWRGADPTVPDMSAVLGLMEALQYKFGSAMVAVDGWTQATPLDILMTNTALSMSELDARNPVFGSFGGQTWEWINLAFLAGGLLLIYKRVFTWHAPVAMLAALGIMSMLFWGGTGSGSNGSPMFHLFSGATMLGAFFIVTDPVSGATSKLGRIIFGAGVGILVYVIRAWGGYPDAVAFSVLLMNLAAPTIDYYTKPRTYGHTKAGRGMGKVD